MKKIEDAYLGAELYASFDGCCIKLEVGGEVIWLNPDHLRALDQFRARIKEEFREEHDADLTEAKAVAAVKEEIVEIDEDGNVYPVEEPRK